MRDNAKTDIEKVTPESMSKIQRSRFGLFTDRSEQIKRSFSGKERNQLFINRAGVFSDLSGVSGLDSPADSRVFVLWDYDRDGWQDIAVINANRPALSLYRNQIKEDSEAPGRFIAVRFVGGNRSSEPSNKMSSRDAYGARITAEAGELAIVREHRCGEGMAAQNSSTMLIGIGANQQVESLQVRWPSGTLNKLPVAIKAGELVTLYEDHGQSPDGNGYAVEAYGKANPK